MKLVYRSDLPANKRPNGISIGNDHFKVVDGAVDVPDGMVQGRLDEMLAHGFAPMVESQEVVSPTLAAASSKK